jgi:patatin-related protein
MNGGTELRLALGMRGGVSLAVWIGGAVAEIDRLRRSPRSVANPACPESAGERFWSDLMQVSTYDSVVVDVLAGASAGGLNGVIYAASQIYDFSFGALRDIWLETGDTERLVRRREPWPSLFQGDDVFLKTVHEKLCELAKGGRRSRPCECGDCGNSDLAAPRIDLRLSATLVEPITRPDRSLADELLLERRSTSGFRFRHPAETWLRSDFPPVDDDSGDFALAMRRLALAARATSSFPAAFEAAVARSPRPDSFGAPLAADRSEPVMFDGELLDRRRDNDQFVLSDGGIVDNIPLGRALDAVAAAPADGPTRRYLVYLQPGVPAATVPRDDAADGPAAALDPQTDLRRSTVSVIRGMAGTRLVEETITDDLAQLERHNEAVARAVAVRRATFAQIDDRRALRKAADAAFQSYRVHRANYDAQLICTLLEDPITTLGEDPFPATAGDRDITDDEWRSPTALWTRQARERLSASLTEGFLERMPADGAVDRVFSIGVRPVHRVGIVLLDVLRYLEASGVPADELQAHKKAIYKTLTFLDVALERPRRLAWVAVAAGVQLHSPESFPQVASDELDALADVGLDRLSGLDQELLTSSADASQQRVRDMVWRSIDDVVRQVWQRLDQTDTSAGAPARRDRQDLRAYVIERVLVKVARDLARVSPGSRSAENHPGYRIHRALQPSGPDPHDLDRSTLAALEVLCFPEFAVGLPCRAPTDFLRLSAANRTPIAPAFQSLLGEAADRGLWWDRSNQNVPAEGGPDTAPQEGIHVNLKLAGNELNNFAAFLRPEWRKNDWMWGRLDAVPTLVDALLSAEGLRSWLHNEGALPSSKPEGDDSTSSEQKATHALMRLVVPDESDPLAPILKDVWNQWEERIEVLARQLITSDSLQVDLSPLADALVARRQWEIIAEELDTTPDKLEQAVAQHAVGAETYRSLADQLATRFDDLATAAGHSIAWNARAAGPAAVERMAAKHPWVERALIELVRRSVRTVFSSGQGRRGGLPVAGVAVVAAVVAAATLLGLAVSGWAFAAGAVVGVAVAGIPAGYVARQIHRVKRDARQRTPDEAGP